MKKTSILLGAIASICTILYFSSKLPSGNSFQTISDDITGIINATNIELK